MASCFGPLIILESTISTGFSLTRDLQGWDILIETMLECYNLAISSIPLPCLRQKMWSSTRAMWSSTRTMLQGCYKLLCCKQSCCDKLATSLTFYMGSYFNPTIAQL